nr:retron Ec67 family RNA-directed DNA polymerase/endonuclease [uncultured Cohaesibacter sp.]
MTTKLNRLKAANSRSDLARLLGIAPKHLSFALYKIPQIVRYREFTIPKASGGDRVIHEPNSHLKAIQARTSGMLYECYNELFPKAEKKSLNLSHAFQKRRGLSIATNGAKHRNKRYVFNLDFEDFFGSFNFGRVRGFFLSNRNFKLNEEVATCLAQICCHENKLPQGAPTSPIVTELITRILDVRLSKIAKAQGCSYSRYADDLTFSTNKRTFPREVAVCDTSGTWTVGNEIRNKIHASGFAVNLAKTRMQFAESRQETTGLVVNKKINVKREYSKQVRYMTHSLLQTGKCYVQAPITKKKQDVSPHVLAGKLAHEFQIKSKEFVDSNGKPWPLARFREKGIAVPAFYRRYSDFLHFRNFFFNEKPIILCEGVTDNIYLKCAIKSKHAQVRSLAKASLPSKKVELLCAFYNYSRTARAVTALTGGANPLKTFIETYAFRFSECKGASVSQPVIAVVDNDAANNGLWRMLGSKFGISGADGSDDFYHVVKNLYIVPIPKIDAKDTFIEHLFDKKTLNIPLNGKTFELGQKGKIANNKFGKMAFARDVVQKQRGSIDFSGFLPLLVNIEKAISHHQVNPPAP